MIKIPISFLTVYQGQTGFMFLHDVTRDLIKVTESDGITEVSSSPPYSYIVTGIESIEAPILTLSNPVTLRLISVNDFRNLFTDSEKIAIYNAAKTDTLIQVFIDDLSFLPDRMVNLDSVSYQTKMGYLVSQGILTQIRLDEIMQGVTS